MDLRGRHAVVTGASRGIGAAVARSLAGEGVRVHALARSEDSLRTLAEEVGGFAYPTDLADPGSVQHSAQAIRASIGGGPDLLVNAAGAFALAHLSRCETDDFDTHYAVNVRAPFLLIRAFLGEMIERGSGAIVQVGSVAGRRAFPENGAYSMSKFGLRGLHEVLLEELRGTGVRATLIEPAATDTALWDAVDPDSNPHLPNRSDMLSPEEVADAIRFVVTRPTHVRIPFLPIEPG